MNRAERFVVDASVAVKWVLPEPDSDRARVLLERAAQGRVLLRAPDVFVAEVANVLWKRTRLTGDLEVAEAEAALAEMMGALPELVGADTLVTQAMDLALTFRRPVYDCLYVALAVRDGSPLVSADRRLVETFGPATGQVIHLRDLDAV